MNRRSKLRSKLSRPKTSLLSFDQAFEALFDAFQDYSGHGAPDTSQLLRSRLVIFFGILTILILLPLSGAGIGCIFIRVEVADLQKLQVQQWLYWERRALLCLQSHANSVVMRYTSLKSLRLEANSDFPTSAIKGAQYAELLEIPHGIRSQNQPLLLRTFRRQLLNLLIAKWSMWILVRCLLVQTQSTLWLMANSVLEQCANELFRRPSTIIILPWGNLYWTACS